jgi:hypothetical protein
MAPEESMNFEMISAQIWETFAQGRLEPSKRLLRSIRYYQTCRTVGESRLLFSSPSP